MSVFKEHYKKHNLKTPVYHFVLGSGYSSAVDKLQDKISNFWEEKPSLHFKDIKQIPKTTAPSHAGLFRFFVYKGKGQQSIVLQCGRVHAYEGHSAQTVVQPVLQSRLAGTKNFIITNISGSLKKEHSIGTVIALTDHFNQTGMSPLVGQNYLNLSQEKKSLPLNSQLTNSQNNESLPDDMKNLDYFPDMSMIYDSQMRESISQEMRSLNVKVTDGIYVGVLGPELETPAHIKWLNKSSQSLFDCVGMSTVLEAIALKHTQAKVCGFSLVSNPAAGVDPNQKKLSEKDFINSTKECARSIVESFFVFSEKQFKK